MAATSQKRSGTTDLTVGKPLFQILRFALPLVLGTLFQQLYSFADTVIVGRCLGTDALGAVGTTYSLNFLILGFVQGACVGFGIPAAETFGAKDKDGLQKYLLNGALLCLVLSVVFTVLTTLMAGPLLRLIHTPEELYADAVLYIRLIFLGIPATVLYNYASSVLRALGDSRHPFYFLLVASVVNILLDYLFIVPLGMGVDGAAIATVLSQCVSAALTVLCLVKSDGMCHLDLRRLHFRMDKFLRIMQVGLPAGMQSVIFNISNVLIQSSVNSFGAVTVAGNTAAANIEGFVYISMNALYQTSISFTSQNLGAKNYHRIDQTLVRCMCIVTLIGLVLGNGAHLLGNHLLHIYSDDLEVISFGMQRLSVISVTYCLCGMMDVLAGTIRGLGYSMLPMIVSLIGACVFRIIWIFTVFRVQHTLFILYASYPISWILTILAHFVCYLIVRKKVFRPQET